MFERGMCECMIGRLAAIWLNTDTENVGFIESPNEGTTQKKEKKRE